MKNIKRPETFIFFLLIGIILIVVISNFRTIVVYLMPMTIIKKPSVEIVTDTRYYEIAKFVAYIIGGLLIIWQIILTNRRTKAAEISADAAIKNVEAATKTSESAAKAVEATNKGQIQERFKNAIDQLGEDHEAVNLGAIYTLHHIAKDSKELVKSVFDILCSYVRETTASPDYIKRKHPSNKIQSILDLLFVDSSERIIYKGLIGDLHGAVLINCNFKEAVLISANFSGAQLQGALLSFAQLNMANFDEAQLQGAYFIESQLQESHLNNAILHGAHLQKAQLQGAVFIEAQLQMAMMGNAELQGANLEHADLQGADLTQAQLQGARLTGADLSGVQLAYAELQGADLNGAILRGARLSNAQLQGANLNNAVIQGTLLTGAQFHGASFNHAFLKGVVLTTPTFPILNDFSARLTKIADLNIPVDLSQFSQGIFTRESILNIMSKLVNLKPELKQKIQEVINIRLEKNTDFQDCIIGNLSIQEVLDIIMEYEQVMEKVPKQETERKTKTTLIRS